VTSLAVVLGYLVEEISSLKSLEIKLAWGRKLSDAGISTRRLLGLTVGAK
jgi:hypothetical protein